MSNKMRVEFRDVNGRLRTSLERNPFGETLERVVWRGHSYAFQGIQHNIVYYTEEEKKGDAA